MLEGIRTVGLLVILGAAAWKDHKTMEIPDSCHVSGILWWCISLPYKSGEWRYLLLDGILGGILIAGGLLVFSLILDRILGKETLGGGDIKLFFVTGLYLGVAGNWLNLMISSILGIGFGLGWKTSAKQEAFPFAPVIAVSAGICLLFGDQIISWYLSLF